MRQQELDIQREQLRLQAERDRRETEKQGTIAGQVKWCGSVKKNSLSKFTHDSSEIPSYFDGVEKLFDSFKVPAAIQVKVLLPFLSDKCRTLLARFDREKMDDYPSVRKFILDEFRLTPIQFKERFEKAIKLQDETYTLFCSRLRNLMIYYHRSRSVYRYEELLSLLIADKIKSTLSGPCLDFILTAEKDEWMPCEKLSSLLDTYYASRPKAVGPSNVPNTGANQRYFKQPNVNETVLPNAATETAVKVTGNAGNQSTQSTSGVPRPPRAC